MDCQAPIFLAGVPGEDGVVWGWAQKLQVVPDVVVGVGGHACLVEYAAWACEAGLLRSLESDPGTFRDLRGVVVGHAVEEERRVSGVGCLHLVPYGVSIMGPCCTDGAGEYGGGPAPVCCPCLGDSAC